MRRLKPLRGVKFKGPKGMLILFLCVAIIFAGYYSISMRGVKREPEEVELTAAQEVLMRDLTRNYPQTPKEVIRYYSELIQCFYNQESSDEEIEQLAAKAKELYDEELAANKDDEAYLKDLLSEIAAFAQNDWEISSYTTSSSTDVEYFDQDGDECARLYCTYHIRTGTTIQVLEEVFILRRDEEGHWKILGWDRVEGDPE